MYSCTIAVFMHLTVFVHNRSIRVPLCIRVQSQYACIAVFCQPCIERCDSAVAILYRNAFYFNRYSKSSHLCIPLRCIQYEVLLEKLFNANRTGLQYYWRITVSRHSSFTSYVTLMKSLYFFKYKYFLCRTLNLLQRDKSILVRNMIINFILKLMWYFCSMAQLQYRNVQCELKWESLHSHIYESELINYSCLKECINTVSS